MAIAETVADLVDYALAHDLIGPEDQTWAYNTIMAAVGEQASEPRRKLHEDAPVHNMLTGRLPKISISDVSFDLPSTLDKLVTAACENGCCGPCGDDEYGIAAQIMNIIMPKPSEISHRFWQFHDYDPRQATSWFYHLSGDVDYVRRAAIAKDIRWNSPTKWGELEISINLSKPEKDPRAIAAAVKTSGGQGYPACRLCMENEGYAGRPASSEYGAYPARQNLRIVGLELGDERWGLQYSPYSYYNEHCIVMSSEHRPMKVGRANMSRMLDFVDLFPHYFVGSNADLPIVGGSILTHDHFQGGRYVLPMERAEIDRSFTLNGFPSIQAGILRWPVTVIRLRGKDREQMLDAATHIADTWSTYSDVALGIVAESEGERHNTVTPIVRRHGSTYEFDIALRCNVTSDQHPLGVFHPHEELWHIKKENIGLIEVMGLAILPARLQRELAGVGQAILLDGDPAANPTLGEHGAWASRVKQAHPQLEPDQLEPVLKQEVANEFARVLETCGVFKWDEAGRAGMDRFIQALQQERR